MPGEIKSRLWTLKIKDDAAVLQSLGSVVSKDLSIAIETVTISDEVGQTTTVDLDDSNKTFSMGVSGNVHTTGNAAWVVLKQAFLNSDSHDSIIEIELDSDDLKITGTVIPKNTSMNTGFADLIKFNCTFVFQAAPTIDDKVADPVSAYSCPTTVRVGTGKTGEVKIKDALWVASERLGAFGTISANKDGTWLVFSSPNTTGSFASQGSLYFFTRSGATFTLSAQKFYATPAASDLFGNCVVMNSNGDRVATVVKRATAERLVIFERVGTVWSQVQALTPSNLSTGFGHKITMSGEGDIIAVSSNHSSLNNKIWIFTRDTLGVWSELKVFTPNNPSTGTAGISIKLSRNGQYLIAGDQGNDTTAANAGRTYIYFKDTGGVNNWGEQAAIAPTVSTSLNFGAAVDLTCDGTYAVSTEPGKNSNFGGFRVYSRTGTTWAEVASVTMDSPNFSGTEFNARSCHFSTDGKLLVVASDQTGSANTNGIVQWFRTTDFITWTHIDSWRNSDNVNGDEFGEDVWLTESSGYLFVGCPGEDDEGSAAGAVYAYMVY